MDLNQCILHLGSKFGCPSLNGWWVMVRTSSKWGKFGFNLIFGLEGQGWLLHKTIGTLTQLLCTVGPNLVILAWRGPELSRRQASDWHTDWHTQRHRHRHTDAGNDNTRRPELASGKNPFFFQNTSVESIQQSDLCINQLTALKNRR